MTFWGIVGVALVLVFGFQFIALAVKAVGGGDIIDRGRRSVTGREVVGVLILLYTGVVRTRHAWKAEPKRRKIKTESAEDAIRRRVRDRRRQRV